MGIAPSWPGASRTRARFWQTIWLPAAGRRSLPVVVLARLGIRQPPALLGIWIATFTGTVTVIEYWRGTRATQPGA